MSVDFDPVKIAPSRRRFDPARLLMLAVAVGVAIAIVKPWSSTPTPDVAAPSIAAVVPSTPSTARSGSPTPAPTARIARNAGPAGIPVPLWGDVERVITAHDEWGVRSILVDRHPNVALPAIRRFQELWSRTTPDLAGVETAYVARAEQSVVALGITFPPDVAVIDARIWRLHSNDELEWIHALPLRPAHPVGSFTYARSGPGGDGSQAWEAGHYRIDVLAAEAVYRIAVQIPGRFEVVPAPHEWPAAETSLVGLEGTDPSGVQSGPFAAVDGVGVPLTTQPTGLMSAEEAWRTVIEQAEGLGRSTVATAYLPRATGLGVMLTNHASVDLAIVRRITPDARFLAAPMFGGISELRGRTPWVAFARRGGGTWPPGTYAITVRWSDPGGFHAQTWHVELRPGLLVTPLAAR